MALITSTPFVVRCPSGASFAMALVDLLRADLVRFLRVQLDTLRRSVAHGHAGRLVPALDDACVAESSESLVIDGWVAFGGLIGGVEIGTAHNQVHVRTVSLTQTDLLAEDAPAHAINPQVSDKT